ncbi:MAG: hypothetical protein K2G13_07675, partial [Muribaculaceae bacterium]|nr:hypothetical protein [Muribaculaceae bacterium]
YKNLKKINMRHFKLINLIACTLLMTGLSACSDNDKDDPGAIGTSVKVTLNCVADKNNDSPIEVVLANNTESPETIEILPGESLSKEFEVSQLPATAGFIVFPSVTDENGKCGFTVKGEVALMDGKRTVKKEKIDEKVTVTDIETDHTKAFLFNVTSEGMQQVTDFTDMDIDYATEGSDEVFEDKAETKKETEIKNRFQEIINAFKVTFIFNQELTEKDYRDSKKGRGKNSYSVDLSIYHAFDTKNEINYYYIEQTVNTAFKKCYRGVYSKAFYSGGCYTIGKVCEWYGDFVEITTSPKNCKLHKEFCFPEGTETSETYTEGFSWNLGGEFSVNTTEGVGGKITGGIGASKTFTKVINDVTIENNYDPDQSLQWTYKIRNARVSYGPDSTSLTEIDPCATVGQSTMIKTSYGIISIKSDEQPEIKVDLKVGLKSTGGKCGKEHGSRTKEKSDNRIIKLPYAKKQGKSIQFFEGKDLGQEKEQ